MTGCFDILHIGHIKLFRFAKKHVDIVVVGIDSDESVKINKGIGRPVFGQKIRMEQISALEDVDFVFGVEETFKFGKKVSNDYYRIVWRIIKPSHIITCVLTDKFWRQKKALAEELKLNFVGQKENKWASSSEIIKKLKLSE